MDDKLQDEALAKADLKDHARLKSMRMPWESLWQEVDERFPDGAGGFHGASPGMRRGAQNFDSTHITALERFAAAGVAITTPEETQYIRPRFADRELQKLRSVKLWCRACRPAPLRYPPCAAHRFRHRGQRGLGPARPLRNTAPMWTDARPGYGLFYRALHLSECYIDVDFAGLVDTVHIGASQ